MIAVNFLLVLSNRFEVAKIAPALKAWAVHFSAFVQFEIQCWNIVFSFEIESIELQKDDGS